MPLGFPTPKRDRSAPKMSLHWNGHQLCSIDVETNGLIPGYHEIIEIAIVPLNPDFTPAKLPFFNTKIRPTYPERTDPKAMAMHQEKYQSCLEYGIDSFDAWDRFTEYFKLLKLPEKKQIMPLGQNYAAFDKGMIQAWAGGPQNYDYHFHYHVRDTMIVALYQNDVSDWFGEFPVFGRVGLTSLCNKLGVNLEMAHDALADSLAAAECYKRLVAKQVGTSPITFPGSHPLCTPDNPEVNIAAQPDKIV